MNSKESRAYRRNNFSRFIRYFWVAAVLCFTFGLSVGFSMDEFFLEQFSTSQRAFIDGVVQGAKFKNEYDDWKSLNPQPKPDGRSDPSSRCAALYFPNNKPAMNGCLQAVEGRPEGGYQIP